MTTKILIADDHSLVRAGLKALLERDAQFAVVAEASTGEEAVRKALESCPDVVLLDIAMPDGDGLQVTRALCHALPTAKVLILTASEEKRLLTEALRSGAAGYVVKRAVESELITAIGAIMRGDLYVDPAVTRALIETSAPPTTSNPDVLTTRETEVLTLLAQGLTNAQVAEALTLSKRTVESHRANIMEKLHARSRADLVRYAKEHGM